MDDKTAQESLRQSSRRKNGVIYDGQTENGHCLRTAKRPGCGELNDLYAGTFRSDYLSDMVRRRLVQDDRLRCAVPDLQILLFGICFDIPSTARDCVSDRQNERDNKTHVFWHHAERSSFEY